MACGTVLLLLSVGKTSNCVADGPAEPAAQNSEVAGQPPTIVEEILEVRRRLGHALPFAEHALLHENLLKESLVQDAVQVAPDREVSVYSWPASPAASRESQVPRGARSPAASETFPSLPDGSLTPQPATPPAAVSATPPADADRPSQPAPRNLTSSLDTTEQQVADVRLLIVHLRRTSSQLDQLANQLEFERRYTDADQLRQLAQRLRTEARERDFDAPYSLSHAHSIPSEPAALRQPLPPPDGVYPASFPGPIDLEELAVPTAESAD